MSNLMTSKTLFRFSSILMIAFFMAACGADTGSGTESSTTIGTGGSDTGGEVGLTQVETETDATADETDEDAAESEGDAVEEAGDDAGPVDAAAAEEVEEGDAEQVLTDAEEVELDADGPVDGDAGTADDDAESTEDFEVIEEQPAECLDPPDNSCLTPGETRCTEDDAELVEKCTLIDNCYVWNADEYCVGTDECSGEALICVQGGCGPATDPLGDCPEGDDPCETAVWDSVACACAIEWKEAGTPCDDGDVCTAGDECFAQGGEFQCVGYEDPDQDGTPICPAACNELSISCGDVVIVDLSTGTDTMSGYSGTDCGGMTSGYDGKEVSFRLAMEFGQFYNAVLSAELLTPADKGAGYADFAVLTHDVAETPCMPSGCISGGMMNDAGEVLVSGIAGETGDLTVVVDGRDGYTGQVRVTAGCYGQYVESFCGNGIDDDSDGVQDCDDPDCEEACVYEQCADDVDNDGDELVDCDDLQDCSTHLACQEGTDGPAGGGETDCGNSIDDDGDSDVDCDDADCNTDPTCGHACSSAIPIACGETLTGEDTVTGEATWFSFACTDLDGIYTDFAHHIYEATPDDGCAYDITITPTVGGIGILDLYAMGPACDNNESFACATAGFDATGAPATVSMSAAQGTTYVTVIPYPWGQLPTTEPYDISMTCTCQ
jgi:hypothetical protein